MTPLHLTLPWPPSCNRYWRNNRGRTHISHEGRAYRDEVQVICMVKRVPSFKGARLHVEVDLFPPDKRRRDLDNSMKCLLDSIQHAGVYDDDGQIDELHIRRAEPVKNGKVSLVIWAEDSK